MNQISDVTPPDAAAQAQESSPPPSSPPPADMASSSEPSSFGSRGRMRRRARFLRKARELAYRDLGGLVFNLHRFGQRNDALVLAKLTTVGQIDSELRALEGALGQREAVTVLREAGINACPRCAAIHSSEDRFCPNCGLSMARKVELPIASTPTPTPDAAAVTVASPIAAAAASPAPPQAPPVTPAPATAPPPSDSAAPSIPAAVEPTSLGARAEEATEILKPSPPGS